MMRIMAVLFALIAAFGYGTGDFAAGMASRRWSSTAVSGAVIAVELACALIGVALFPGHGPSVRALAWGALAGVGGASGTLALYRGLAVGSMTVVATLSAVHAAVVPVLVGLALGNHLGGLAAAGVIVAIPAIALVSWEPGGGGGGGAGRSSIAFGLLAGCGFALLFIATDRAGTGTGAWPVVASQTIGTIACRPVAVRTALRERPSLRACALIVVAGILAGGAALFFLAATGRGELSIVAVITSLYPAFTILLARVLIGERWSRFQVIGLVVAAASIVLVSVG
jgi:drug/metabolite transporter (DMT)-like permease